MLHYIHKEKIFIPLLKEPNQEIDILKSYFNHKEQNFILNNKENILLEDKIMNLGRLISQRKENTNRIKFNSIKDKEIIKLTKEIKKDIFKNDNKILKEDYNKFLSNLSKINNYFDSFIKNEIDHTLEGYDLSGVEIAYIYNLIDNEINGCGPITELLEDPNITEIMVNDINKVYIEICLDDIERRIITFRYGQMTSG